MEENKSLLKRIETRISDKDPNVVLVTLSIICNSFTIAVRIGFGIYLRSGWLLINAAYFILIAVIRYFIMKCYISAKKISDEAERYNYEYIIHKYSGGLLLLIGTMYILCCIRMFMVGDAVTISGIFVYFLIMFTLLKLGFAIYGMVMTRNCENPIIRVMKVVGIADSFVAVCESMYAFLSLIKYADTAKACSTFGMLVSIIIMLGGMSMIKHRNGSN